MTTAAPLRIVISGGSGQIGRMLASYLHRRGHTVTVLTRGAPIAERNVVHWDAKEPGPWVAVLEGSDVCINLTGRSIDCRLTPANRRELYDSRIGPTQLLHRVIALLDNPPRLWLNASTATIYRHSIDRPMDEATGDIGGGELIAPGRRAPEKWDATVRLVQDWEEAFFAASTPKTRKVALRTSLVFSPVRGGVFEVLSNLARFRLGGAQGSGRQYVSWIHEADYARCVDFLIEHDELEGPVNLTAPNPLPNREFMRALRHAWGVRVGLPAPAPLIEMSSFFLRTESELVLKSRYVVPGRLLAAGFDFQFPSWSAASEDLVRQWRTNQRKSL